MLKHSPVLCRGILSLPSALNKVNLLHFDYILIKTFLSICIFIFGIQIWALNRLIAFIIIALFLEKFYSIVQLLIFFRGKSSNIRFWSHTYVAEIYPDLNQFHMKSFLLSVLYQFSHLLKIKFQVFKTMQFLILKIK